MDNLLDSLPLAERLLRYRQFSQDALRKAGETANDEMRLGYLSMATGWHMLATEVERFTDRQPLPGELALEARPARDQGQAFPDGPHKNGF